MADRTDLHLFEGYGIECEYMLVERDTLKTLPISDKLLTIMNGGELTQEVELGTIAWSNELVMHVLELKGNGPVASLSQLQAAFKQQIHSVNGLLKEFNGMLLPTAMHPFFDPDQDTHLWPHGNKIIYETYNRIFSCKGHGWSNLQSVHINLPFFDDSEFAKLHAAIRLVLPILPTIAASSPIVQGKIHLAPNQRLNFYKNNQKKIPFIAGSVIPEPVFTKEDYDREIFQKMYRDIEPFDPDAVLQEEWLNSRGAIARFDRNAIEIRVLDIQECLRSDFAIIAATVSLVRALVDERFIDLETQKKWSTDRLAKIFNNFLESGSSATIGDQDYLQLFGAKNDLTPLQLWQHLLTKLSQWNYVLKEYQDDFAKICEQGCLGDRIRKFVGNDESKIMACYQNLAECLSVDQFFVG